MIGLQKQVKMENAKAGITKETLNQLPLLHGETHYQTVQSLLSYLRHRNCDVTVLQMI